MSGSGSMPYGYYSTSTAKYVNANGYNASGSWGLWNKVDPLGSGNLDVSGGVFKVGGSPVAGSGMFVVDVDWDGFYRGVFNTSYFGVFGLRMLGGDSWFPNHIANVGNKNVGSRYWSGEFNWMGAVNSYATGWETRFMVDGDVPKMGVNSYLNVINADGWENYGVSTVGGAGAEISSRGLNLEATTGNESALWFSSLIVRDEWNYGLKRANSPYVTRGAGHSAGYFFASFSSLALPRPLCKTAILSHLGT